MDAKQAVPLIVTNIDANRLNSDYVGFMFTESIKPWAS